MIQIIKVNQIPRQKVCIGHVGENEFRQVIFDVSEWKTAFPDGNAVLVFVRPDGYVYPIIPSVNDDGNPVFIPTSTETAVAGSGEMQLRWMQGEAVGKTCRISISVHDSVENGGSIPDDPEEDWISRIIDAINEASPRITVSDIDGGHTVTIFDASGEHTFNVMDGKDSAGGAVESVNGKTGAVDLNASDVGALPADTVIPPAVTEHDVAEWGFTKNTGDYSKPDNGIPKTDLAEDVRTSLGRADTALQQHQSLAGYATESYVQTQIANIPAELHTVRVAMTASDTTPTLDPNKLYVFPEMASLTPTLNTSTDNTIVNEYHFVFDSGSTATVLTLPATVLQPDWFTVEANMHYEVSILEGAMTAQGWAVTST